MPNTTYMIVDPRRDHSMRVPRPDLTVSIGVPNACNTCHSKQDAKWAAENVRKWYGHDAQGIQDFGPVFHDAEVGKPRAGASLAAIASNPSQPAIVRASALDRLAAAPVPAAVAAGRDAARNSDPLLRLAAAHLADSLPPRERIVIAAPLLSDPLRTVRIEAANAMAGIPQDQLTTDQRAAWRRASEDYIASQRYNADRPEARTNLGGFYARLGRSDDAQTEFRAALKLDRRYVPAYVNAADTYRAQGRDEDAIRILREGIAAVPASAPLHHSLGLAYVRTKQPPAAMSELARAAQLAPDSARYAYVYAVALYSDGRKRDAIRALDRDAKRWPADRDILMALATMQRDAGNRAEARRALQSLLAADPEDREARALLEQLR
jgi:tetratricopeptide (TPR) repeat protein